MARPFPEGYSQATIEEFTRAGYWGTKTLSDYVRENAIRYPEKPAFVQGDKRLTWQEYDEQSVEVALALVESGIELGDKVAVYFPDWPSVHVLWMAVQRAGGVVVAINVRAGEREAEHILHTTRADAIITAASYSDGEYMSRTRRVRELFPAVKQHFVFGADSAIGDALSLDEQIEKVRSKRLSPSLLEGRGPGPNDVYLINSTSGTTGLPKCNKHTHNKWLQFARWAGRAAHMTSDDIFMSPVPTPGGFGLWAAHNVPTKLGATTVTVERFNPELVLQMIERERATILCGVSTEMVMLLGAPNFDRYDLSSLRAMFTGGEAVPYQRALEFETRAGCAVLQFYGSNELGGVSCTTMDDPQEKRLRTAGRIIPESNVRLFDPEGKEIFERNVAGQPAVRGPSSGPGYYNDNEANAALFRSDGWTLAPDLVKIDEDDYLTVVGRVADIIIRGGLNISAGKVEQEILLHPAVGMAAVVGMPDAIYGEKACAYVELKPGHELTLQELCTFLLGRGNSKTQLPERLEIRPVLPRSTGGKIGKADLRADIKRKLEAERTINAV